MKKLSPPDRQASIGSAVNHLWDFAYAAELAVSQKDSLPARAEGVAQRGLTLRCDPLAREPGSHIHSDL